MSLVTDGLGSTMVGVAALGGTTWEEVSNTIRSTFNTYVTQAESVITQWPNVNFDPPDNARWCKIDIMFGDSQQKSLGKVAVSFRTTGVVLCKLYAPSDMGDQTLLELADLIAAVFRSITYNAVVFRTPSISTRGQLDRWWEVHVTIPFYYDRVE